MNRKRFYSIQRLVFCLCAIGGIHNLRAQSTNAPILKLAPGSPPALTVTGTPGASYQVQFASQLAASNQWTALTNILLSNSAYLLQDPATASNAARFYRALLLSAPSNIFNGYAPSQILSGEIYQFVTSDGIGPIDSTQTLFISSATNGIWIGSTLPAIGPVSAVSLNFTRLTDLTIQLDVTFPATSTNSPPTTNSYLLAFDSASAGVVAGPLGSPQPSVGNFSRITNLIGANVTSQLTAGQIWNLSASNGSFVSSATLVMDSPSNSWWIVPGNAPGGSISPATAQFTPQGPLGGTLVVVVPSSGTVTNMFSIEFTATNSGLFEGQLLGLSPGVASFTLDTSLVGKSVAPSQLAEGEIYQLSISNAPTPTPGTIAMESPTAGWVAFPGNQAAGALLPPPGAILPDTVQYNQLGPLTGNLTVTGSFNPPSTNIMTNTWTLVFTATNSGFMENMLGTPMSSCFGTFIRNAAFLGQTLAPQQLTTGDIYNLTTTSSQFTVPSQSFTVNSPTDGLWQTVQQSPSPTLTTLDATLQYNRLGPLTGTLTAVYPTTPTPSTNSYTLLFTGTNIGTFEGPDSPGSPNQVAGTFLQNTTLENQTLVPSQLNAGEIYQLVVTNFGTQVVTQTLVVNSSTSGLLIVSGNALSGNGIFSASIQYAPFGAFGANLTLMVGGSSPFTNIYLLDFTSTAGGQFEVSSPGFPDGSAGGFTRSTALVGQNFAPQQLVDGESFQLTATNQPPSTTQTLIMNSATTGFWAVTGGIQGGFYSASVQYAPLGPLAANLNVIVPPGTNSSFGFTNNFILVFNSATNGIYQGINNSSFVSSGIFIHNTP